MAVIPGGGDAKILIGNDSSNPVPVSIEGVEITIDNVTVSNEVEIKNDSGNPIPISDAGGSITVDSSSLTSIDGKLPALVNGKVPVDAAFAGGATEAKQDTLIAAVDGVEGLLTTIDADTGSIDGKLPALSGGKVPVVGPLTDTELRATAVPVSGTVTATGPLTDTQLRATAVPVSGPLTDTQLRASAVPTAPNVQQGGGAITASTTRVTLATDGPGVSNLASIAGLAIPAHDYISFSYTGTNLTGVTYKTGGSGGTTVGTLTLAYSGSQLTSVTKS